QIADAPGPQDAVEAGGVKAALAGLVDDDLAGMGRELRDDGVPGLAAGEDPAAAAEVADAQAMAARAPALVRVEVGGIAAMALARMDHGPAGPARGAEQVRDHADWPAGVGDALAELVDPAARCTEIDLHVDHQEGGVRGPEIPVERPGIGGWNEPHCRPRLI